MSWKNNRPDGWENPFDNNSLTGKTGSDIYEAGADAMAKAILIRVGREANRLDGSVYLVPDYHKYREALKEIGVE